MSVYPSARHDQVNSARNQPRRLFCLPTGDGRTASPLRSQKPVAGEILERNMHESCSNSGGEKRYRLRRREKGRGGGGTPCHFLVQLIDLPCLLRQSLLDELEGGELRATGGLRRLQQRCLVLLCLCGVRVNCDGEKCMCGRRERRDVCTCKGTTRQ